MPQAPITKPKLLLGEGKEEVDFFNALLVHLGIIDIQVDQYGGKTNIATGLKGIKDRSGFSQVVALGVTRDADYADNPADDAMVAQRAFQSVCGALTHAGLAVPNAPMNKTLGTPEISVYILPDNLSSGMLEDVCVASMNTGDADCINEYFDCVTLRTGRAQLRRNLSKSLVHAWLATQAEPDKRLGIAAQAGYWDWNNQAFDLLKQFLQQL